VSRRHAPWIASLSIHVGILLALLWLPEPAAMHDPFAELTAIELVELPADPTPTERATSTASVPAPSASDGASSPRAIRRVRGRAEVEDTTQPDPPAADAPADPSKAVALHGLRGSERAVPRPSSVVLDERSAGDRYGPETAADARSDTAYRTAHEAGFRRNRKGELVFRDSAAPWSATLLPDGRVRFEDHLRPRLDEEGGIAMPGLKELVPAAKGFDFWQARKRRLLKETRELRLAMAVEHAEKNIDRQLSQLYRDLLEIWQDDSESAASRRKRIFERWDECTEALSIELGEFTDDQRSKIDALREDAGTKARAKISEFVRKHLPEGGEDAYGAAELRTLNERRVSRERFDPYGR
jgi:hypothetical protein